MGIKMRKMNPSGCILKTLCLCTLYNNRMDSCGFFCRILRHCIIFLQTDKKLEKSKSSCLFDVAKSLTEQGKMNNKKGVKLHQKGVVI